jgi:hypothetical protein
MGLCLVITFLYFVSYPNIQQSRACLVCQIDLWNRSNSYSYRTVILVFGKNLFLVIIIYVRIINSLYTIINNLKKKKKN